jgi:hypothetical protein
MVLKTATVINNGGIEAQSQFLVEKFGEVEAKKAIRKLFHLGDED